MATPAEFSRNVLDWSRRTQVALEGDVRLVALELFKRVIMRTPVDTGAARGNWGVSVGSIEPPGRALGGDAVQARDALALMRVAVAAAPVDRTIWLSNNLPYIRVLEYGLYPNPPKRGSWVRGKRGRPGRWEVKSVGGYSRQAPQGMVRVSIAEVRP